MTVDVLDRLSVEVPIVQAGMGGGIATGRLAGAVSRAGGLGTVGMLAPGRFAAAIHRARDEATGRAVAANLLLPHLRRGHVADVLAARPRIVVLFFGDDRDLVDRLHRAGITVLQQVGTAEEADAAFAAGVDGLIAQGREAGGHLRGVEPATDAVTRLRDRHRGLLLLAAGGVAERADVTRLVDAGADGVVAGSRFLLTVESRAHRGYKDRVLAASETLETQLFGLSWPARHRVVPNAATDRWCRRDRRGAATARAINRLTAPLARLLPPAAGPRSVGLQRRWLPVFTPQPALEGMPEDVLDVTPLYAGESALRVGGVSDAASVVRSLAGLDG